MTYAELVQKIRDYTEVDANVLTRSLASVWWTFILLHGFNYDMGL